MTSMICKEEQKEIMEINRGKMNTILTIYFLIIAKAMREIQNFYKKEPYLCVLKRKILT